MQPLMRFLLALHLLAVPAVAAAQTFDISRFELQTHKLLTQINPPDPGSPPIEPHQRAVLSPDAINVVAGNNQFGLEIYRQQIAAAKPTDNLLVSPFSISAALSMTYAGARGATAEQMANVLHFTLPAQHHHAAFGELLSDLTAPRTGYEWNVANRLFGQSGYSFRDEFLQTTADDYLAPLEPLDFASDPDGSRKHINTWVAEQTRNRITDLLPGGSISGDTRLVLTNAVYFKGDWKSKFNKQATFDAPFYGATGESQVETMHQHNDFGYAERPGFQMLEMPYAGDDLSMVVMLPTDHDGLGSLEASLTPELLAESLASLVPRSVNVSFPKFTFRNKFQLGQALAEMGMADAFGGKAISRASPMIRSRSAMCTTMRLSRSTRREPKLQQQQRSQ